MEKNIHTLSMMFYRRNRSDNNAQKSLLAANLITKRKKKKKKPEKSIKRKEGIRVENRKDEQVAYLMGKNKARGDGSDSTNTSSLLLV